jgi:hypothetical protein
VATPPGGHQYSGPQRPPLKRFNFPSAPSPQLQPEVEPEDERTSGPLGPVSSSRPSHSSPTGNSEQTLVGQHPAQDPGVGPGHEPAPAQGAGQVHRPVSEPVPAAMPAQRGPEPSAPPPRIQPHVPAPPRAGNETTDARLSRPTPVGSDQQPLVRPYAMTGGRTRPRYQLAIEALVTTTADPEQLRGQLPEHQRICQLCWEIKSVAEVSALLSIPLGVTRILVADLAEAGLVAIHQPGGNEATGGQPDVTLLERVLSGLRKL